MKEDDSPDPGLAGSLGSSREGRVRKFRLPMAIVLIALVLFISNARAIRGAEEAIALPETKQYGDPGPGKILIFIKGQVAHPGQYYVEQGATLAELLKLVGGFLACPDCQKFPTMVSVYPGENRNGSKHYILADVQVLKTVLLRDGDHVSFWHFRL
jgi:hypothetical protein